MKIGFQLWKIIGLDTAKNGIEIGAVGSIIKKPGGARWDKRDAAKTSFTGFCKTVGVVKNGFTKL